jgi:glycerate kinase
LADDLLERELLLGEGVRVGCGLSRDVVDYADVVLVAPDSFKGTLSAVQVARAIAAGLRKGGAEAIEMPIGDGGEGTMEALVATLGGEYREAEVSDPLGRPVTARFALLPDGRAVVETAQASGFALVAEKDRDPWAASTRGTGELIVAAVEAGAQNVLVTVGGSATMDGGAGAVEVLDEAGVDPKLEVLCDVRLPFEQAPSVFGPQKGADAKMVKRLERRLDKFAAAAPRDPRGVPMTAAAGALSGGLYAYRKAKLVLGAAYVLDTLGFDDRMREARAVVTGEGKLDQQTLAGKAVGEVATRCRQAGVWCHAVVGTNALDQFAIRLLDFASVRAAGTEKELRHVGYSLARESGVT